MMQSYASAAKLRGGGSILHSGLEAMVLRRITATSDSSANPQHGVAKVVVLLSLPFDCCRL